MRAIFFTGTAIALAVANMLMVGLAVGQAEAAIAHAAQLADWNIPAFQNITNVCGSNGCVRVQTQRVTHHQRPGTVSAPRIH